MTTTRALLAEAAAHGVTVFRVGDRLRWRAAAPPPPELVERLRQHKAELFALVPADTPASHASAAADSEASAVAYARVYAAIADGCGTREDVAAFAWAEHHTHPDILTTLGALERRCEDLARRNAPEAEYRVAVARLVGLFETVRAAYAAREADTAPATPVPAAGTWHVVVERTALRPGPIRLPDGCTTITDPTRCVAAALADLELAVAHKNAGRDTSYTHLIDERIARLAACGCRVRVEAVV